jgi:UV DNA damage endonuclease
LEHQSEVMSRLGLPPGHIAPVNIHLASGREGERALKRINSSLAALSDSARSRLVFENEDKDFWTWQNISRHFPDFPITLDSHHHLINNEGESLAEAATATAESWGDAMPVRHISDGAKSETDRDHHDWVREIPGEFLLKNRPSTDIEVEAKMKDLSVLYLKAKYKI